MDKEIVKVIVIKNDIEFFKYVVGKLEENNIKYKTNLEEDWSGFKSMDYTANFEIYVEKENEEKAIEIINKYNENNSVEFTDVKENNVEPKEDNDDKKSINGSNNIAKVLAWIVIAMIAVPIILGVIGMFIS